MKERKKEGQNTVMKNLHAIFRIRDAVGRSQKVFKIDVLENFLKVLQEKSYVRVSFYKAAEL